MVEVLHWALGAYLAIGVLCAVFAVSEEVVDQLRNDPEIAQRGNLEFGFAMFVAALVLVVAWPLVFTVRNDDV